MRGVLEGVEILSEVLCRWPHARMCPREGTALPDWSPVSQRHFKAVRGATIVLEWADHIIVLHTSKKNSALIHKYKKILWGGHFCDGNFTSRGESKEFRAGLISFLYCPAVGINIAWVSRGESHLIMF